MTNGGFLNQDASVIYNQNSTLVVLDCAVIDGAIRLTTCSTHHLQQLSGWY